MNAGIPMKCMTADEWDICTTKTCQPTFKPTLKSQRGQSQMVSTIGIGNPILLKTPPLMAGLVKSGRCSLMQAFRMQILKKVSCPQVDILSINIRPARSSKQSSPITLSWPKTEDPYYKHHYFATYGKKGLSHAHGAGMLQQNRLTFES